MSYTSKISVLRRTALLFAKKVAGKVSELYIQNMPLEIYIYILYYIYIISYIYNIYDMIYIYTIKIYKHHISISLYLYSYIYIDTNNLLVLPGYATTSCCVYWCTATPGATKISKSPGSNGCRPWTRGVVTTDGTGEGLGTSEMWDLHGIYPWIYPWILLEK